MMRDELLAQVTLRPGEPGDRALVIDTWARTHHDHALSWLGWVSQQTYVDLYRPTIVELLRTCMLRVVCLRDEPGAVVGWACVRDDVIHYVWVRSEWRREGVARYLLDDLRGLRCRYTHETDAWIAACDAGLNRQCWGFDSSPIRHHIAERA